MKKDKKYTSYITVGTDKTGKRIRKHIYANTKTELNRLIAKAYNDFKERQAQAERVFFKDYAEQWIETYKSMRQPATLDGYHNAFRKMSPLYQKLIGEVTSDDIQMLMNQHKQHPYACEKLRLTLQQIFDKAVEDELIDKNPMRKVETPKMEQSKQRALTPQEIQAIKNCNFTPLEKMYIHLLFYLGLRPQEAFALKASDFDFQNGTVSIERAVSYDKGKPFIKATKNYITRIMPIPVVFLPEVKLYLETEKIDFRGYLLQYDRQLITKRERLNMWKRIKSEINHQLGGSDTIDMTNGLRPYTFRHNFCTECYHRRISILMCSRLMGNSPKMVMEVYAHLDSQREPLDELKKLSL